MQKLRNRKWVAFYSHSGKEIIELSKRLGYAPDYICTNNPRWHETPLGEYHLGDDKVYKRIDFRTKWTAFAYHDAMTAPGSDALVTLHGWMRIVPKEICEEYEIYNGHPALCDVFPELKGKDMQEAVINKVDQYPVIGSIVHECTAELDSGKVVERVAVPNFSVADRETIYNVLRDTSLQTWLKFLPSKLT